MAITKVSDLINPEVMGDMIDAKVEAQAKLLKYAHVDTSLEGVPGDTKTVPSWNYIGDAEDFDPESGDEIEASKLTATKKTFTIKCAAKSVSIYQTAINSGLGDPVGQAEAVIGNPLENAIWEEYGTGEYALKGNGRKNPWVYKDERGWHTTHGKKPLRPLQKAFDKTKSKIIKRLGSILNQTFSE